MGTDATAPVPTGGPNAAPDGPLLLLDGMSLAFRAYFALPPDLATSAGVVTNAVHGFVSMLHNLTRDQHPGGIAVAFDLPGGTFRDALVADYKGGRAETPPDLPPQFEMIRTVLESLAIPVVEAPDYEADDILATLATQARDRGHDVVVVTGDRDSYQLVEDPHIRVLYNRRGVSDYALYDEAGIEERTGVRPPDYPLLASLRGDPSDNLPGVPGVGEKTAAKLVNEYGDLDTIYGHLDALSPKLRENLAAHEGRVRQNLDVIPLVHDVPLDVDVDDLRLGGWVEADAQRVFESLELRTLWTRIASLLRSGAFGSPAAGTSSGGADPDSDADVGVGVRDVPAWLEAPVIVVPADPADAARAVADVVDRARAGTGNLAVLARWTGDAGRSPLGLLALAPEHPDGTDSVEGVVVLVGDLGDGGDGAVLDDPSVTGALAAAVGPGGAGVVAHDAKEIMRSLLPSGVDVAGLVMDTAVAAYLLDSSTDSYRLADLAAAHLGVAVDDGEGAKGQGAFALEVPDGGPAGDGGSGVPAPLVQAAVLVSVVGRLRTPLTAALTEVGEQSLHDDIERPLVRVLARMEVAGICVDRAVLEGITSGLAAECQSLEALIQEQAGGPFNVNSVPQLREVLYERLGLTPLRKTKTGYSTDARTLEQLRDQHPVSGRCCATGRWRSSARPTARAWPPRSPLTAASTPPSARRWPGRAVCRRTGPTSTTSRYGPTRAGGSERPSSRRRATGCWSPTTTRWSCGPSPTCRATPGSRRPSPPARTSTGPWPPGSSASLRRT